jgi:hypothetical protein
MLSKRKPKKLSNKYVEKVTGYHELECSMCNTEVSLVSRDVARFTCGRCVQSICAPPENYKKSEHEGYQRGWHFKKRYEAPDGKIYAFGKLVEEDNVESDEQVSDESPTPKKTRKPRTPKVASKKVTKQTRKKRGSE